MSNSGTLRSVGIGGVSYDAAADVDVSEIFTRYEITAIPTSGKTSFQYIRRATSREGVALITSPDEREVIKSIAEALENTDLQYTLADGSTYVAQGRVSVESNTTSENRTTVFLLPEDDWTKF
jgi:hypothetical protein